MTIPRYHFTWQPPSLSPIATLVIVSSLVLQGCTTPVARQPLTEAMRGNIHILKIEVTEELPRITLELPSKGAASGAGRTAGKWAGNWAMTAGMVYGTLGMSAPPIGLILGVVVGGGMLALTPVVAAAGAVKGAFESPSAESVESSDARARGILQAEDLLQRFQEQVLKEVMDKTSIIVAGQPQAEGAIVAREKAIGPSKSPRLDLSTIMGTIVVQENTIRPGEGRQPNSVLKIQLQSLELHGPYDVDPELALHLEAEVTLTTVPPAGRSAYPSPLRYVYTSPFRYVTRGLRMSEWMANDAKLFTEAVNLSLARLAELIVDDLFLTYYFVHERSDERERLNY